MKFSTGILFLLCVLASWRLGAGPLLAPRQSAQVPSPKRQVSSLANRVDYIAAEQVVGRTRYRYHAQTWATNVSALNIVDVTNAPMVMPALRFQISWDQPVALRVKDSAAAPDWNLLTAAARTIVEIPNDAPQKFFQVPVPNQTAGLAWNASLTPTVVGYTVYVSKNDLPIAAINLGNVTNYVVSGLEPGGNYSLFVTAYDNEGSESGPSNTALYTAPVPEIHPEITAIR